MWRHLLVGLCVVACAAGIRAAEANPVVVIDTSLGAIEVELYADKAPKSVENFLDYVKDKFYDGTIFHRVISNFMIQGGGFGPDLKQKDTKKPVKNEADNGLKNLAGTIALARLEDPDTAATEFFINTENNPDLDHKNKTKQGYGYCVFGKVVSGMDVVTKIKAVKTGKATLKIMGMKVPAEDVPLETVTIKTIRLKEAAK